MPQPPITPVFSREVVRSVPFVVPRIFVQDLAVNTSVYAEFDTLEGFAEPSFYNNALAYPGVNIAKPHAVGPYLDAAVFITAVVAGEVGLLTVEYAIDRGCAYHLVTAGTLVPDQVFVNISGLRITGRFVRVTLSNPATNTNGIAIEFGTYVRSS